MAIQNNKKVLHRKEWQMMSPAPVATAAGAFIIKDPSGIRRTALFISSATVQYIYAADEDGWMQLPSFALGGTFAAGACGTWGCWSNTLIANGGSTTDLTTATKINDLAEERTLRFITGQNAGEEIKVDKVLAPVVGNCTISFKTELPYPVSTNDTFIIRSGRYFILNAGTVAAGIFKSYDPLTGVVTSLGTTGLPATWGTEGKMVATPSYVGDFAIGQATSATSTTLVNTSKSWSINQWCNYQVIITGGTGKGQIRTITLNNATSLTVPTWTITPDSTSTYAIQGNDDFIYLTGNAAVTMYRYSISAGTWTTLSPTVAKGGALGVGGGMNWVGISGNSMWAEENNIQDGRYIYSFRGGSSTNLDRYDIAGGTNGAGAWTAVIYMNNGETFTTGSSYDYDNGRIYIIKNATARMFLYNVITNTIYPFCTDFYPDSTAVLGDKLFTVSYNDGTGDTISWIYRLLNTSTVLRRIMIY